MFQDLSGKTINQYQIVELLGAGGMAAVYRAYQTNLDREVAVKVISPSLVAQGDYTQRFYREARTIAALEHSNIVPVYDFGTFGNLSYVVMRLLTGGSLEERVFQRHKSEQPLPSLHETSRLLHQISSALDYAHGQGVIHRDIKASNVMFDNHGNAFIVDFGIARLLNSTSQLTGTGITMGTPSYMAPEQWRNEDIVPATDQYSTAILIYFLLTGDLPFKAKTPYGLMQLHFTQPPTPPRVLRYEIPEAVDHVVTRAMAKEPQDRYPSMALFATAFEQAIGDVSHTSTQFYTYKLEPISRQEYTPPSNLVDVPTVTVPPSSGTGTALLAEGRPQRRTIWFIVGSILGLLLIVAVGIVLSTSSNQEESLEQQLTRVMLNLTQTALIRAISPAPTLEAVVQVPTDAPSNTPVSATPTNTVTTPEESTAVAQVVPTHTTIPTVIPSGASETAVLPVQVPSASNTPTLTPSDTSVPPSATPTASNTSTSTPSDTPSPTASNTPTSTPSDTSVPPSATPTASNTSTSTPSDTPSPTASNTPTSTPSDTPVPPSATPTASDTPTSTPSDTASPTASNTPTSTPSETPVPPSATPTASDTPTSTATNTPTASPTPSPSPSPVSTPNATATAVAIGTATRSAELSMILTQTQSARENIFAGVEIGVVISGENVNVREGPGTNFAAISSLPPGQSVSILEADATNGWLKIRLPGGGEGWIFAQLIQSIGTPTPPPTTDPMLSIAFIPVARNSDWTPIIREFNGVEMVLVPVGCFSLGSTQSEIELLVTTFNQDLFRNEGPQSIVCFNQPFWIDRFEVTNEQFQSFNGQAAQASMWTDPDRPREQISWFEAKNFCELRDARLPTEAEWEYAARGPDGLEYPYGNEFDPHGGNYCDRNCPRAWADILNDDGYSDSTAPVGSYPSGSSWVAAEDLSGNVWEWVVTIYDQTRFLYPYNADDGRNNLNNTTSDRVQRGGAWHYGNNAIRNAARGWGNPNARRNIGGFRCVKPF